MTLVKLWVTGGVVVLILGVLGLSALTAQRPGVLNPYGSNDVGRYVVAHSGADGIVLLDTTTGELYRAMPADIKPHYARPRDYDKDGKDKGGFDKKPTDKDK